jgi:hypothetical protein
MHEEIELKRNVSKDPKAFFDMTHLISHGVPLKAKFLREVKENVFNLFVGYGNLFVGRPSRIRIIIC